LSTLYFRFAAPNGGALQRAPLLERLLARADDCQSVADWRGDAFRSLSGADRPPPPPAPTVLVGAQGAVLGASAALATPVHCVAGMSSVHLDPDGILRLSAAEATALAADFNRHFAGADPRLSALPSGVMVAVFDRLLDAKTVDPEPLRGRDIAAHLPSGTDGPVLRRLTSELEMWLFEHPLNRARLSAGGLPITALWLWGEGPVVSKLPTLPGWAAGEDALFSAWPARPAGGALTSAGVLAFGRVLPGSPAWSGLERDWLMPAIAALNSGRIAQVALCAGTRRYTLSARTRWRIWRRPRPWWSYFDAGEVPEFDAGEALR
jgi:hypothetical protein